MMIFPTGLGTCGIGWSEAGVTQVMLPAVRGLKGTDVAAADPLPRFVTEAVEGIRALLDGEHRDLGDVRLDWGEIDDFRRRVYVATRAVGPGELATYGELAKEIGAPDGARAV